MYSAIFPCRLIKVKPRLQVYMPWAVCCEGLVFTLFSFRDAKIETPLNRFLRSNLKLGHNAWTIIDLLAAFELLICNEMWSKHFIIIIIVCWRSYKITKYHFRRTSLPWFVHEICWFVWYSNVILVCVKSHCIIAPITEHRFWRSIVLYIYMLLWSYCSAISDIYKSNFGLRIERNPTNIFFHTSVNCWQALCGFIPALPPFPSHGTACGKALSNARQFYSEKTLGVRSSYKLC